MRAIFFRVPDALYVKLKTECARRGISMQAYIIELIIEKTKENQ